MRKTILVAALAFALSAISHAAEKPHWTYDDGAPNGPTKWGDLKDDEGEFPYRDCKISTRQSPINIVPPATADRNLPPIEPRKYSRDYRTGVYPIRIGNSGHAIEVTPSFVGEITVDSRLFALKQFHFHAPSEHTLNGKRFEMEIHFVHEAAVPVAGKNNRVVVAVLVDVQPYRGGIVSSASSDYEFDQISKRLDKPTNVDLEYGAIDLLPKNKTYVRYDGSLTTPPCTPDVIWLVLTQPIEVIEPTLARFKKVYAKNARPLRTDSTSVLKISPNYAPADAGPVSQECWQPYPGYRGIPINC